MKEVDKLYNYNGNIIDGYVIGFLILNNKKVIVYKEKNSNELLASYYKNGLEKEDFILTPIEDKNELNELERRIIPDLFQNNSKI